MLILIFGFVLMRKNIDMRKRLSTGLAHVAEDAAVGMWITPNWRDGLVTQLPPSY